MVDFSALLNRTRAHEAGEHVAVVDGCTLCSDAASAAQQEPEEAPAPVEPSPFPDHEFVTGPAGTGKTFMMKDRADKHRGVVLCATTGIAAVNLGDCVTLNSYLGYFDTASLRDIWTQGWLTIKLAKLARGGLRQIVLDEVSMMDGEQLIILCAALDEVNEKLEEEGRHVGLTLTGDFCQLPPVKAKFAFEVDDWQRFAGHTLRLREIRRQADRDFIEALQLVRQGKSSKAVEFFAPLLADQTEHDYDGTTLLAKNVEVDRYNLLRLAKLDGAKVGFESSRWGKQRGEWNQIPETLQLKIGALVMVLANKKLVVDGRASNTFIYVNGDLGELVDVGGDPDYAGQFATVRLRRTGTCVQVEKITRDFIIPLETGRIKQLKQEHPENFHDFYDGEKRIEKVGSITYMPLRCAYATTVHKCVTGDTRILVEKRGSVRVEDLRVGDWVDTGSGPTRVKAISQTFQRLCALMTARGYRVTCSPDHRWKTPDSDEGFTPLSAIKRDMRLLLTCEAAVQGTNLIDKDTAWWIGVMVGDGNWTDRKEGAMHFTCSTPSQRDRWMTIAAKLGGRPNTRRDQRGCHLTSLPLRLRLEAWGCAYVTAAHKRIPEAIWQSGPTAWAACMQGLFDADGAAKDGRIVYCTRSRGLVDDMQLLLLYLGIPSTVGEYNGRTGLYWHIRISAEGKDRFLARVGASHPQKLAALRAWKPNRQLKPYDGTDSVKTISLGTLAVPMYDIELETIHELGWGPIVGSNSQGLSLDNVQANIRDHFFASPGMLYVALSRARTAQGLRLVGSAQAFVQRCIVDRRVIPWL